MDEPNPYAPPAVTMDTRQSDAPLPSGVRRFRLNPARFDRFARIVFVQLLVLSLPLFAVLFLLLALAGISPTTIATFAVVSYAWLIVARIVRVRLVRRSHLESYELLVSDRAARRNLAGWVSAEILRPEVSRIAEVPTGLWLICETPPRSLFVASALESFDDARAAFSAWRPIETVGGFNAWNLARRNARKQGARDESFGTALTKDPSLEMDLTMLRSVSQTPGLAHPPSRAQALLRVSVIWFALVFAFLALWQFLAPSGR